MNAILARWYSREIDANRNFSGVPSSRVEVRVALFDPQPDATTKNAHGLCLVLVIYVHGTIIHALQSRCRTTNGHGWGQRGAAAGLF